MAGPLPSPSAAPESVGWLNLLLARLWYDVKESAKVEETLIEHFNEKIQLKLGQNPLVKSVQVVAVDFGAAAPTFTSVKILPPADGQLQFELQGVKYDGGFNVSLLVEFGLGQVPVEVIVQKFVSQKAHVIVGAEGKGRFWVSFDQGTDCVFNTQASGIIPSVVGKVVTTIMKMAISKMVSPNYDDFPLPLASPSPGLVRSVSSPATPATTSSVSNLSASSNSVNPAKSTDSPPSEKESTSSSSRGTVSAKKNSAASATAAAAASAAAAVAKESESSKKSSPESTSSSRESMSAKKAPKKSVSSPSLPAAEQIEPAPTDSGESSTTPATGTATKRMSRRKRVILSLRKKLNI